MASVRHNSRNITLHEITFLQLSSPDCRIYDVPLIVCKLFREITRIKVIKHTVRHERWPSIKNAAGRGNVKSIMNDSCEVFLIFAAVVRIGCYKILIFKPRNLYLSLLISLTNESNASFSGTKGRFENRLLTWLAIRESSVFWKLTFCRCFSSRASTAGSIVVVLWTLLVRGWHCCVRIRVEWIRSLLCDVHVNGTFARNDKLLSGNMPR